jgi:hypothetical protein
MVVEFTFFLIGQELALLRGIRLGWFVRGHGHAFVSAVAWIDAVVLCRDSLSVRNKQKCKDGQGNEET